MASPASGALPDDPALARAAQAGVHCLPIPTPFAVGRVNTYLVEDDPLTLVDAGPNSATSLTALETALAAHGRRVEELERIVVTHQHLDHTGLVQILADRSGAEVCALDALAPWLADFSARMKADDDFSMAIMHRYGVPDELALGLRSVTSLFRAWGAAATVTTPLAPGSELVFAQRTWTVHHRPGHSPSDTIFEDRERRMLVAGDHVLKRISSNPLVSRPLDGRGDADHHVRALMTYIASMRKTRELELDLVLGGHGEPVTDHVALIDERIRMHHRRADKLEGMIAEGPVTAFELAQRMWGNVAVTQAYLALSEVLGHVDLLLDDGRAVELAPEGDGPVRFASAA